MVLVAETIELMKTFFFLGRGNGSPYTAGIVYAQGLMGSTSSPTTLINEGHSLNPWAVNDGM